MKITIAENSIDINELKGKLETKFPQFKHSFRNKLIINIAQTSIVGCTVMVHKKKLLINGNFPSMTSQIVFTICLILLGVIIPLIIYFAVFHKKMKAVENEVAAFIKSEYNLS